MTENVFWKRVHLNLISSQDYDVALPWIVKVKMMEIYPERYSCTLMVYVLPYGMMMSVGGGNEY